MPSCGGLAIRLVVARERCERVRDCCEVDFESVANNLRESFRVVAGSRTGGEVRELHGVSIASAGVTFQMFNAAFLSGPVTTEAELKQRLLLPSVHFNTRGLEWAYWVCEDWLDGRLRKRSRSLFERHGLRLSTSLPGMIADRILPPVKKLPGIEIRRVCEGTTRDAFCEIGSVCFHVPISWFKEVFDSDSVWERFISYVGYVDAEPVTTTSIVVGGVVVGVYNVSTLPGHQKRGYGEAVMRHAVADVRRQRGLEQVVLQSTPAGLKLYERIGFRTVARVAVYSS
jgi:ribosomal protein S18 acetylase RimI-like enzyme